MLCISLLVAFVFAVMAAAIKDLYNTNIDFMMGWLAAGVYMTIISGRYKKDK